MRSPGAFGDGGGCYRPLWPSHGVAGATRSNSDRFRSWLAESNYRAPRTMTILLLESRRCGATLVFTVDFPRKRLRLRDLRPVLCVPGTRHHHAAAIRSSVTRRRML